MALVVSGEKLIISYRLLDLHATLDEVQDSLNELVASINSKVDPNGLLGKVRLPQGHQVFRSVPHKFPWPLVQETRS